MAIPILNHMDFQKSAEIRNVRLHNQAASGVTSPGTGQILYDSGTIKFYNGSAWVSLSSTSGTMSNFTLSDGSNTQTIGDSDTLTVTATSGTGISATVGATDTLTIAGTDASTSAKGVASFSSDNFAVSSGAVTIKDGGVANAELANSSITINGTAISLGGSVTTPNDNTQLSQEQVEDFVGGMLDGTETGISVSYDDANGNIDFVVADSDFALTGDVTGSATQTAKGNVSIATTIGSGTVHHSMLSDDIISGQNALTTGLASDDELMISDAGVVKRMDVSVLQSYLQSNLSFTSNTDVDVNVSNLTARLPQITESVTIGDATDVTVTTSGDLVVTGDLTVSGDTITANVGTLDVEDKNITVNKSTGDSSATANGAGLTIQDAVDASTDATMLWDATNDEFDFSHPINVTGKVTATGTSVFTNLDISGDVDVDGTLEADAISLNGTALGALATLDSVDSAQITNGSVDNVHLAGSIANSKLANSSITINGTAVSLGGSVTTPDTNTQLDIASASEVQAGTNNTKAVSPDSLAAKSVHATIDVSDSSFTSNLYAEITHSLGTEDVIVQLFDSSTKETVYADIARTDKANSASTSKIKITFAAAPANDIEVLITSIKGSTAGTVAYS